MIFADELRLCILQRCDPTPAEGTTDAALLIRDGQFARVLRSPAAVAFFSAVHLSASTSLTNHVHALVDAYHHDGKDDGRRNLMHIGVAALLAFLQASWTGPALDFDPVSLFHQETEAADVPFLSSTPVLESLTVDGEEPYRLSAHPLLLALAKGILCDRASYFMDCSTAAWWKMRTLFVLQRILENPAASLKDELRAVIATLEKDVFCVGNKEFADVDAKLIRQARSRFFLECGLVHHFYHDDKQAKEYFTKAQKENNLVWSVSGALGRRTKFQTFDVSQLVLFAESANANGDTAEASGDGSATKTDRGVTPATLPLNDDTLLESISFTKIDDQEKDPSKQGNLEPTDQCILLSFCLNVKNENPADGITSEQMVPFVTRVLDNANNWMVHTMALLLRSRLESNRSRTVERSALQLQALVDQIPLDDPKPVERLNNIFALMIPAKWELERELGERFISLGVVRSALEIFQRLEMWDDVVSCLQMLEQQTEAEAIVRKQLESTPNSPKLHCLLGDILRDPKYYEQAWELSNHRYARAMRSLGAWYFRKGDFVLCVNSYKQGLAINPLFEHSWFVMGCAALRAEDFDNAEEAFRKTVTLDNSNGEAWTNLASVYLRKNQKRDAWRALREALRQHHENSKIWDNYLVVSTSLGEFSESIRSMSRVLEIRTRNATTQSESLVLVDLEVLAIVQKAVIENPSPQLLSSLAQFLQAASEKISNSSVLYTICAEFYRYTSQWAKALDFYQKAYRLHLQAPGLSDDKTAFLHAVTTCERLVLAYKDLGPKDMEPRMGDGEEGDGAIRLVCPDWRYQAKSTLRTIIGRTKVRLKRV
ncbi:hypothetical protein HK101_011299 [Irineochytrium annulatum]|nr:hypothetical protein HK101_011299 [Irineochytrium annulatum]